MCRSLTQHARLTLSFWIVTAAYEVLFLIAILQTRKRRALSKVTWPACSGARSKHRLSQTKECASQLHSLPPTPGNSMSRSKMLRCFQGRSRHSQPLRKFVRNAWHLQPRKPVPRPQAREHTSSVICKPDSGLRAAAPSRGHGTLCLKVKYF